MSKNKKMWSFEILNCTYTKKNFFVLVSLTPLQMPNYTLNVIYRNCTRANEGTPKKFYVHVVV